MRKSFLIIITLMLADLTAYSQSKNVFDISNIDRHFWILPQRDSANYKISTYQNAKALFLINNKDDYKAAYIAYPSSFNFKNGTIEVDLAAPDGKGTFLGICFRVVDEMHYQTLYFRPGATGTINAVQYMPKNGQDFNWWDYEGSEYQATATLPLNGWFHVKAIVHNETLKVYVDNSKDPVFTYNKLNPFVTQGSVGFWMGNSKIAVYKNLTVTSE